MSKKLKPYIWQRMKTDSRLVATDNFDKKDYHDWNNITPIGLGTDIISPYKAKTLEDLRHYSAFIKISSKFKKLKGGYEVPWVQDAEQNNRNADPFNYFINDWGFRDKFVLKAKKPNIGFFGCSMTFGEGVETKNLWSTLVADYFNLNRNNFGVGGAGPMRVARTFAAVQNIFRLKYAIVMMPQASRIEAFVSDSVDVYGKPVPPRLKPLNIIPSFPPSGHEELHNSHYKVMTDEQAVGQILQACNWITQTAKANNTHVVFTSWDTLALWTMHNAEVPKVHDKLFKRLDFGRDDNHPGIVSNARFAKSLCEWIDDNTWV